MKRLRGTMLVELMVAISVSSVLLVIATGAIHRAMRVESNWRQQAELSRALGRLSHDFRADVHRAQDASLTADPIELKLTAADGTVITYEVADDEIIRDYQPASGARAREFYKMSPECDVQISASDVPRWITLQASQAAHLTGVAPRVVLHVEAELGRLARLIQTAGGAP